MCTVTFIYKGNNEFILTSNRDESPNRKTIPPKVSFEQEVVIISPKDVLAGGTWIGASSQKRALCILNGGFKMHERSAHYQKSRGLVVKELLTAEDLDSCIENQELANVEPFTLVIIDYQNTLGLLELVWDGANAHLKELPLQSHIWSSSTLYSDQMKMERKDWFHQFLAKENLQAEDLINFHLNTHADNNNYGVVMDRVFVKTTSTTQVEKLANAIEMRYYDLQNDQKYVEQLQIVQTVE